MKKTKHLFALPLIVATMTISATATIWAACGTGCAAKEKAGDHDGCISCCETTCQGGAEAGCLTANCKGGMYE